MTRYIIQRVAFILVTTVVITFFVFIFVKLLPNYHQQTIDVDPITEQIMREREGYGRPVIEQFFLFVRNIFKYGTLGMSLTRGRDVTSILSSRLPITMRINIFPYLVSIPLAISLGVWAALKKNKTTDYVISTGVVILTSIPAFVVASMTQYYVTYVWKWTDSPFVYPNIDWQGNFWGGIKSYIMPITVMVVTSISGLTRVTRAELTEVLTSEFMLLCRTKGLNKRQATVRHALRNGMVPIAPSIIGGFISILSGSLIFEQIFRIPGVGVLYLEAFNNLDYPLLMGLVLFYTAIGLTSSLIVDISYGFIDPRMRIGAGKR